MPKFINKDYFNIFFAVNFGQFLSVIKGFIVVKFLSPSLYGLLQILSIISQMNKYGSLGFLDVARRELPFYRGKLDVEQERLIRNNSYTCEVLLTLVLFFVAVSISFFYEETTIKAGIIISSFALLVAKIQRILLLETAVQKQYTVYSRALNIFSIANSIVVILAVPFAGFYAPLSVPILASMLAIVYISKALRIDYNFKINIAELKRQIPVGIPFALKSGALGFYYWSEKLIVLSFFNLEQLGYYGFARMIMNYLLDAGFCFRRILNQTLIEKIGRGELSEVITDIEKIIKIMAILLSIGLGLSYILIPKIVLAFLPKYADSLVFLNIFLITVYFFMPSGYLVIIINAPTIDKQNAVLYITIFCIVFFIGTCFVLKYFGLNTPLNVVIANNIGYLIMAFAQIGLYIKVANYNFIQTASFFLNLIWPGTLVLIFINICG